MALGLSQKEKIMSFAPTNILVPIAIESEDDLFLADHALSAACDLAQKFSAKITIVHLTKAMIAGGSAGMDMSGKIYQAFMQVLEAKIARGRTKLKELQSTVEERGIAVEVRLMDSLEKTSDVIIDTAKEVNADLIVIGSHGRSGLSRILFGSVAERVAENAPMPVLLLHPQATAE